MQKKFFLGLLVGWAVAFVLPPRALLGAFGSKSA